MAEDLFRPLLRSALTFVTERSQLDEAIIYTHSSPMRFSILLSAALLASCSNVAPESLEESEIGFVESLLSPAQRRERAGQIRDAAAAAGMTEGWLLAGIADAETGMSHCHSELTWACMGPSSPDCGGGPVVAGAGDGPCPDRQGGLGMFQFDAGTYEETLAREGDRILSIAGNVAAAVDFVANMVIRSTFIDGVSNRAEAIEWMNGVRIGNARWDPWVSTVVRYYNGCSPTRACWANRYPRYRDFTADVYNEMGADFWGMSSGGTYAAAWVEQTFPLASEAFPLAPGEEYMGFLTMRNVGTAEWNPGEVFLGTTEPRDGVSAIRGPGWVSGSRVATVPTVIENGEEARFEFSIQAPTTPGTYPQYFNLVHEEEGWFASPGDDVLQIRVEVEALPCPGGLGETWECDGDQRQRCIDASLQRQTCPSGCVDGACAGTPDDADGDGHNSSVDCDDNNPSIFPGADDPCGDGIDSNCDERPDDCDPPPPSGRDAGVGSDAGGGFDGGTMDDAGGGDRDPTTGAGCGGCSTSGSQPHFFAVFGLLLFARRRRQ